MLGQKLQEWLDMAIARVDATDGINDDCSMCSCQDNDAKFCEIQLSKSDLVAASDGDEVAPTTVLSINLVDPAAATRAHGPEVESVNRGEPQTGRDLEGAVVGETSTEATMKLWMSLPKKEHPRIVLETPTTGGSPQSPGLEDSSLNGHCTDTLETHVMSQTSRLTAVAELTEQNVQNLPRMPKPLDLGAVHGSDTAGDSSFRTWREDTGRSSMTSHTPGGECIADEKVRCATLTVYDLCNLEKLVAEMASSPLGCMDFSTTFRSRQTSKQILLLTAHSLEGVKFGEAWRAYAKITMVGLKHPDGYIVWAPHPETKIRGSDGVLLIQCTPFALAMGASDGASLAESMSAPRLSTRILDGTGRPSPPPPEKRGGRCFCY